MLDSIKLEIRGYKGFLIICIRAKDNELHYSKESMRLEVLANDEVSPVSVKEFSKRIDALHIPEWKETYTPEGYDVFDGESWTVTYMDSNSKTIVRCGENAYPPNWKKFLKALRDAVGNIRI